MSATGKNPSYTAPGTEACTSVPLHPITENDPALPDPPYMTSPPLADMTRKDVDIQPSTSSHPDVGDSISSSTSNRSKIPENSQQTSLFDSVPRPKSTKTDHSWPKFIIIEAKDSKHPITSLKTLVLSKAIAGIQIRPNGSH